jgi:hypothetical protein
MARVSVSDEDFSALEELLSWFDERVQQTESRYMLRILTRLRGGVSKEFVRLTRAREAERQAAANRLLEQFKREASAFASEKEGV